MQLVERRIVQEPEVGELLDRSELLRIRIVATPLAFFQGVLS